MAVSRRNLFKGFAAIAGGLLVPEVLEKHTKVWALDQTMYSPTTRIYLPFGDPAGYPYVERNLSKRVPVAWFQGEKILIEVGGQLSATKISLRRDNGEVETVFKTFDDVEFCTLSANAPPNHIYITQGPLRSTYIGEDDENPWNTFLDRDLTTLRHEALARGGLDESSSRE